ncbi:MAG: DivIVA domain-containing protein [Acidimicrobiia bacterium]
MSDTSGPPLVPSRDAQLTADDVAERSFSQVKRGYDETEVRAFLRLVADELSSAANQARELAARVQSLEGRLAMPTPPPSDQDLIAALGEETARVLGQAREAAVELRTKAEEHARTLVREAQEGARQLRATTQQNAETKAREVEDTARARANEILAEARTMRDRVLSDLAERRQELERQVTELRAGRGRLVETYQVVERALAQATRVMTDEPGPPPSTITRTTPPAPAAAPAPAATPAPAPASAPAEAAAPEPPAAPDAGGAAEDAGGDDAEEGDQSEVADAVPPGTEEARDVGALFDRLRSEQSAPPVDDGPPVAPPPEISAQATTDEPVTDAAPDAVAEPTAPDADGRARQARDDVLAAVGEDLARRAKRAVQDEQNDVLDGLRRQRGKIDTTKVLPAADEQLARWAHVLQPAVDRSYEAGAASTGAAPRKRGTSVPASLLTELTSTAVAPLRSRLEESLASVDARTPADLEITIAQALGAKYREWRTQDLDTVLGDALAVAYSRGVYDAAPAGARLRWVPERKGKCPDCDDNALEPTTKGSAFPTGQTAPPAHPGCRCLLVVEPEA